MNQFKIGDCVILKHGSNGIIMTVDEIKLSVSGLHYVTCVWNHIDTKLPMRDTYSLGALEKCDC